MAVLATACAREPVTVRSQSGQFIVRGLPLDASWARYPTGAVNYLRLDPSIAAVALQRIRHAAFGELGLDESWRGPVRVNTFPVQERDPRLVLTSVHFNDGWAYRLDLPEIVNKDHLVEAGVRVALLEFANRNARGDQEAVLPDWLVKGLSAQLRATSLAVLALDSVVREGPNHDPLHSARQILQRRPPLKFDDLAMPSREQLAGDGAPVFDACAHVFVSELLQLRNGASCLSNMLARLPENLNWQTTFLSAFQPRFARLLEVDKWYSVAITSFGQQDTRSAWSLETTLAQLEEIVTPTVEVRTDPNQLPVRTPVSLQRLIGDWDISRQYPVLSQKIQQLQALQRRGAPEAVSLVAGYASTLQTYLRSQSGRNPRVPKRPSAARAKAGILDATQQLDTLDAQREALRQRAAKPARAPEGREVLSRSR